VLYPDRLAEQVERLAHHATRGEVWDKAVAYNQQAGARVAARSAYREAVAYFEQALAALEHLPEHHATLEQTIDLRLDLRNVLFPLDEHARIFDHLRAAEALAERLDDPQRLGWIACYLCNCFSAISEHDGAIAVGQRALALATTSGAFDVQVVTLTYLGVAYYTAEALGMRPLQAHCHLGLGTLYARTGQRQQAQAALSTAIDLYRAMDMTFWLPQAEAALAQVEGRPDQEMGQCSPLPAGCEFPTPPPRRLRRHCGGASASARTAGFASGH